MRDSSYQCRLGRTSTDPAACGSTMQTDSSFSISQYISQDSGVASTSITQFYQAGNIIFASGVVVRRASNDPAWPIGGTTTISTPTTPQSTNSGSSPTQTGANNGTDTDSGLSTGAKAGIGIGVSLGALLIFGIIVAAFLVSRRKRRAAQADAQQPVPQYAEPDSHPGDQGAWGNKGGYREVPLAELEEQRRHSELNAHHEPREPVELMNQ
jgi:hypothetical protein